MIAGDRIVVHGKIYRFVQVVTSSWNGITIICTDSKGYLHSFELKSVRVPRK